MIIFYMLGIWSKKCS